MNKGEKDVEYTAKMMKPLKDYNARDIVATTEYANINGTTKEAQNEIIQSMVVKQECKVYSKEN